MAKKKTITTKNNNKNKTPGEWPTVFGGNLPAQECQLTLDHLSVPADSTTQDHAEYHAEYLEDKEEQGGFAEGKTWDIQAKAKDQEVVTWRPNELNVKAGEL